MGYTSFKNLIKERFGHLKFDLEPPDSGPKTPANKKNSDRQNVSNKQVRIFKANIVWFDNLFMYYYYTYVRGHP